MTIKTSFGIYNDCYLHVSRYLADNSLYVAAWSRSEGGLFPLTVCLDDLMLQENESYIDVNNVSYSELRNVIIGMGYGVPTGKTRRSGYVVYPVVAWDMEKLLYGETVLTRCFDRRG